MNLSTSTVLVARSYYDHVIRRTDIEIVFSADVVDEVVKSQSGFIIITLRIMSDNSSICVVESDL